MDVREFRFFQRSFSGRTAMHSQTTNERNSTESQSNSVRCWLRRPDTGSLRRDLYPVQLSQNVGMIPRVSCATLSRRKRGPHLLLGFRSSRRREATTEGGLCQCSMLSVHMFYWPPIFRRMRFRPLRGHCDILLLLRKLRQHTTGARPVSLVGYFACLLPSNGHQCLG